MNIDRLGWIAAAALAGAIVGMGFRAPSDKTGIVDMNKVFDGSDLQKDLTGRLHQREGTWQELFRFVTTNRVMKLDDINRLHDLALKDNPTATDNAEMERIRTDAQAEEGKARDLEQKSGPSDADKAQLQNYSDRSKATQQLLEKWSDDFRTDMANRQQKVQEEADQKVRQIVQQVGRDQGYSIIFSSRDAPYCPNDITKEASSKINQK